MQRVMPAVQYLLKFDAPTACTDGRPIFSGRDGRPHAGLGHLPCRHLRQSTYFVLCLPETAAFMANPGAIRRIPEAASNEERVHEAPGKS